MPQKEAEEKREQDLKEWAEEQGFTERPCRKCSGRASTDNTCENCQGVGVVYEMHGQEHPLRMLELIRVAK